MADISGEGKGEFTLTSKSNWETLKCEDGGDVNLASQGTEAGNRAWPGARSAAGFHNITTGMGREYLVLMLGERNPALREVGHDGGDRFWDDVWILQVMPQGLSAVAVKDATWQGLGHETGEGLWSRVKIHNTDGVEGDDVGSLVLGGRGCKFSMS